MVCHACLCKADLAAAFQAAREAGWERVSLVLEVPDGRRFEITAASAASGAKTAKADDMTPLEKWRADRVKR